MPTPRERLSKVEYPQTVAPQEIQEEFEKIQSEVDAHTVYTGLCVGGPMDGMEGVSRYPKGFVLVDIPNQMCWVYDRMLDHENDREGFKCRPRDHWNTQRGEKAAQESNYDVRSFDAETMLGPRGYDGEPHSR